jgi:DNA (cytosine-5)-methyltransferase 1
MADPSRFKVELSKGPVVHLEPHPSACSTTTELLALAKESTKPIAADLFSGAGGMSLGLAEAGFDVLVGVDFDDYALKTYESLFPGMALKRDLSEPAAIEELIGILRQLDVTLIAGGPPCQPFSRAGRSAIRNLVKQGARPARDHRRDLWQSFVEVVTGVQPAAVMMENVPDLALGDETAILRLMVDELESIGYSVETQLVDAWRFGVPQHRQRLIMVALRDGAGFEWPGESDELVTVGAAIGDLPVVEGGWQEAGGPDGYFTYDGPQSAFQKRMRAGLAGVQTKRIYDHITRAVRPDDLEAFAQMDSTTAYAELDDDLRRYRSDIFEDKYKRLDANGLSRTILAHLAKDGYWFIHPDQHRTITLREAARLQTFPDHVRFEGPPTAAFRQIGNAVPVALAATMGKALLNALSSSRPTRTPTRRLSNTLARWYETNEHRTMPWLWSGNPWAGIQADVLLGRANSEVVRIVWPVLESLATPQDCLAQSTQLKHLDDQVVSASSRPLWKSPAPTSRADALLAIAAKITEKPETLESSAALAEVPGLAAATARLAVIIDGDSDEELMISTHGATRVAARYSGKPVDRVNIQSHGRVEMARIIGAGDDARLANLALIELANSVCVPQRPRCAECPLNATCTFSNSRDYREATLFPVAGGLPAESGG